MFNKTIICLLLGKGLYYNIFVHDIDITLCAYKICKRA